MLAREKILKIVNKIKYPHRVINFFSKQDNLKQKGEKMDNYLCTLCGYIYKPEDNNNIDFKDLDNDWVCPVCSANKEEFEKI